MPDIQEFDNQEINSQEQDTIPDQQEPPFLPAGEEGVYGVVKCYFFTPKRGDIWGAFCILFNGTTGETMENVFWVTRNLTGPSIDVNVHWRSLNKLIAQMGTYEKSLGEKLSVSMIETFSSAARIELCRSENPSERLHVVSEEIRNVFERATHCFLEFQMAFERMTAQDLESAGLLGERVVGKAGTGAKNQEDEKSFAGTIINCLPAIDPVHGVPVSELKPDDMVEVKLQGGVGAAELIHKFLSSTNQEAIFPVESIETRDEKTFVFLKINEELKGIVTVTKDLRLRVLSSVKKSHKNFSISINLDNVVFFGVLLTAFVIIAFVVKILLFDS